MTQHFSWLQVLGPFHSGTCLMFNYQEKLFDVNAQYHTCFWKHSLPPRYHNMVDRRAREIITLPSEVLRRTLFICMVRLPYFWLLSILRESYELVDFSKRSDDLSGKIRSPVQFDGCRFENLVQLWNVYYQAYLNTLANQATVHFVRLEDLVQKPQETLSTLDCYLQRQPHIDLKNIIEMISNKPAKIHEGNPCVYGERARTEYLPERVPERIKPRDLDFINRHLDHQLMEFFGYPIVKGSEITRSWNTPSIGSYTPE